MSYRVCITLVLSLIALVCLGVAVLFAIAPVWEREKFIVRWLYGFFLAIAGIVATWTLFPH